MYFLNEQIEIMTFLQNALRTPFNDLFFKFWNFFDAREFFFLFIPFIWLGCHRKLGIKIFYGTLISSFVNSCLKEYFQCPRPFVFSPELAVITVSGLSFPSGAAQTSVWLPFILAMQLKRNIFWVLSVCFALFLSFSRVYLGVHFPLDLLAGWFVGGGILCFLLSPRGFERVFSFWEAGNKTWRVLYVLLIACILFTHSRKGYSLALVFMGVHMGMLFFPKYDFQIKNICMGDRLLRVFLGLLGIITLSFTCSIFSSLFSLEYRVFVEIPFYFLIGAWLSVGANIVYIMKARIELTP